MVSKTKSIVTKTRVHPRSKVVTKNRLPKAQREATGVVYLGRLPKTFFESDIRTFFAQFGQVNRVRLSRSKKNGNSKGYAYVEFQLEEIAKIAAQAMNNYFINGRAIKAEFMEKEKVHAELFKGFKMLDFRPSRVNKARIQYAKDLADKDLQAEKTSSLADRLKDLGIAYTLPTPQ